MSCVEQTLNYLIHIGQIVNSSPKSVILIDHPENLIVWHRNHVTQIH